MVEAGKLKVVRPRHVQPAVAVQVSDPAVLVAEAGRLFRAGDYQHALRHARAAAALGPDNAVVREDVVRLEAALRETIEALAWAVVITILLRAFVIQSFTIPSPSMVPTVWPRQLP